jgi:hypothetical protein
MTMMAATVLIPANNSAKDHFENLSRHSPSLSPEDLLPIATDAMPKNESC